MTPVMSKKFRRLAKKRPVLLGFLIPAASLASLLA